MTPPRPPFHRSPLDTSLPDAERGILDTVSCRLHRVYLDERRDLPGVMEDGFKKLIEKPPIVIADGREVRGKRVYVNPHSGAQLVVSSFGTHLTFSVPRLLRGRNDQQAWISSEEAARCIREYPARLLPATTARAVNRFDRGRPCWGWILERSDLVVHGFGDAAVYARVYANARTPRIRGINRFPILYPTGIVWAHQHPLYKIARGDRFAFGSIRETLYCKGAQQRVGDTPAEDPLHVGEVMRFEVQLWGRHLRRMWKMLPEVAHDDPNAIPFEPFLGGRPSFRKLDYALLHRFLRGEVELLEGKRVVARTSIRASTRRYVEALIKDPSQAEKLPISDATLNRVRNMALQHAKKGLPNNLVEALWPPPPEKVVTVKPNVKRYTMKRRK